MLSILSRNMSPVLLLTSLCFLSFPFLFFGYLLGCKLLNFSVSKCNRRDLEIVGKNNLPLADMEKIVKSVAKDLKSEKRTKETGSQKDMTLGFFGIFAGAGNMASRKVAVIDGTKAEYGKNLFDQAEELHRVGVNILALNDLYLDGSCLEFAVFFF